MLPDDEPIHLSTHLKCHLPRETTCPKPTSFFLLLPPPTLFSINNLRKNFQKQIWPLLTLALVLVFSMCDGGSVCIWLSQEAEAKVGPLSGKASQRRKQEKVRRAFTPSSGPGLGEERGRKKVGVGRLSDCSVVPRDVHSGPGAP